MHKDEVSRSSRITYVSNYAVFRSGETGSRSSETIYGSSFAIFGSGNTVFGSSETAFRSVCAIDVVVQHFVQFFFSLFHQRADDEVLTRLLQTSLFLVASPILVESMFFSCMSSLTLSIQIFLCFPLLPLPSSFSIVQLGVFESSKTVQRL